VTAKRAPIHRPPVVPISSRALMIFRRMQRLERRCHCEPRDWSGEYWKWKECANCQKWRDLHSELHDELKRKPWQWPCVQHPDTKSHHPKGSPADLKPYSEAQALWCLLNDASRKEPRRAAVRAPVRHFGSGAFFFGCWPTGGRNQNVGPKPGPNRHRTEATGRPHRRTNPCAFG
jgi:hypothetical protein